MLLYFKTFADYVRDSLLGQNGFHNPNAAATTSST